MEKIDFIAIKLHDIDFQMTFINLLKTIQRGFSTETHWSAPLSKQTITEAIVTGITFHYLIFQLRDNLGERGYGKLGDTLQYLYGHTKILFNEEALNDFMNKDGEDGCWILNTQTGEIVAY